MAGIPCRLVRAEFTSRLFLRALWSDCYPMVIQYFAPQNDPGQAYTYIYITASSKVNSLNVRGFYSRETRFEYRQQHKLQVYRIVYRLVEVELTLRLTVSQSVCLGIEYPCATCGQILLPVGMLVTEICSLVSVGRPLWRENGSPIWSVITQWSGSLRTRNHILLSPLRLPQPGGPGPRIYFPQEQGGPVIPPGTGYRLVV
jgi:hypothetical protein